MNFIPKWRKGKKPPVQLDDCEYDSDRKRNRRNLMALLGGVAGFGIASKASAQQPSTLTNMPYASTPLSGAELTYVVQSGVSKKTPVSSISGSGGGTPGGTNGQLQYNNSGSFGGYGVGSGLSVVGGDLTATGGGVSGMQVVTSLAALQAIASPTDGQSAYLSLGGRSGIFIWSSANHKVDVDNDPGQGEWVAPGGINVSFTVTGTQTPVSLNGTYVWAGYYGGANYYARVSGGAYLWADAAAPLWAINPELGSLTGDGFFQGGFPYNTPSVGAYSAGGLVGGTLSVTLVVGTNGTTGAWQRQWNGVSDWAWWGAIADCVRILNQDTWLPTSLPTGTDNGGPFVNWQKWAVYKTSQGSGVVVSPSFGVTGVYGWNLLTATRYWFNGIAGTGGVDLHVDGRGVIGIQQLNSGAAGHFPIPNNTALTQANAFGINTTTIGATLFICTVGANASNFTIGMKVLLMSLDIQYIGYPPNTQNYEYRQITQNGTVYPAVAISSATYTTGTGLLAMTFATPPLGTASTTSSSTNTIGLGNVTFVVPTGLTIPVGQGVTAAYTTTPGDTMSGTVVSYDAITTGNMVVNVTNTTNPSGSTTGLTGWTITFSVPTLVGQWVTVNISAGTGSFASLSGVWQITSQGSLTITVAAPAGLTATVSAGTLAAVGVVNCDAIECNHVTTYPDVAYGGGLFCGLPRVWLLGPAWDATHIYEGLITGLAFNPPVGAYTGFVTFNIKKTVTIDWVGPGFSESVAQEVIHVRAKFKTVGETDKLVSRITYYDPDTSLGTGCQSCCPRNYIMIGGRMGGLTGWGQNLFASGVTFNGAVTPDNFYGLSYGATFENCRIVGGGITNVLDGGNRLPIDGTNVTYTNGVLSLNIAAMSGAGTLTQWSAVPGMIMMLEGTASDSSVLGFTGDYGALLVLSVTVDNPASPTVILIATNGPPALTGSWKTGFLRKLTVGPISLRNCQGPDQIRNASAATDAGQPYYQWFRNVIMGNTNNPYQTALQFGINGLFVSFECDVTVPHPTSNATVTLIYKGYTFSPTAITLDAITIVINISIAGKRTINLSAFTGNQSGDSVAVQSISGGAGIVQPLPLNHMLATGTGTITAPAAPSAGASPVVKITAQTDCGISRQQIPPQQFGQNQISNIVLPMQGQQQ